MPTTTDALDRTFALDEAYLSLFSGDGSTLLYSTYLGGGDYDWGIRMAVDGSGAAYVTGYTHSSNFPTTPGAFDTSYNGNSDAFVVKMNNAGTDLIYATFLGGPGYDSGHRLKVRNGEVYLVGSAAQDFPVTVGAFDTTFNGCANREGVPWCDGLVARLSTDGSVLVYATYLGGSDQDWLNDIEIAPDGTVLVIGPMYSTNIPITPGAYDTVHNGDRDVVLAKLSADGGSLIFATYFGGSEADYGNGVALTNNGAIVIYGGTSSPNMPTTTDALDRTFALGEAYLSLFSGDGSTLLYSTYLGGGDYDWGTRMTVDGSGAAYVTGYTGSSDFPTTPGAFDRTYHGNRDAFVVKLAVGGGATYLVYLPIVLRRYP